MLLRRPRRTDQKNRFLDKVWTPQFSTTPPKPFLLSFSTHLGDQTLARSIWKRSQLLDAFFRLAQGLLDLSYYSSGVWRHALSSWTFCLKQLTVWVEDILHLFLWFPDSSSLRGVVWRKLGWSSVGGWQAFSNFLSYSGTCVWRLRHTLLQKLSVRISSAAACTCRTLNLRLKKATVSCWLACAQEEKPVTLGSVALLVCTELEEWRLIDRASGSSRM